MSYLVICSNGLSFRYFDSQSLLLTLLCAVEALMLCSVYSAKMWSHIVVAFLLILASVSSLELIAFLEKSLVIESMRRSSVS
jgi:hypothetical protein